jgi:hypothetical protein
MLSLFLLACAEPPDPRFVAADACADGDAAVCLQIAETVEDPYVREDWLLAACAAGDVPTCEALVAVWDKPLPSERSRTLEGYRARIHEQCKDDGGSVCVLAGLGRQNPELPDVARACLFGHAPSCDHLDMPEGWSVLHVGDAEKHLHLEGDTLHHWAEPPRSDCPGARRTRWSGGLDSVVWAYQDAVTRCVGDEVRWTVEVDDADEVHALWSSDRTLVFGARAHVLADGRDVTPKHWRSYTPTEGWWLDPAGTRAWLETSEGGVAVGPKKRDTVVDHGDVRGATWAGDQLVLMGRQIERDDLWVLPSSGLHTRLVSSEDGRRVAAFEDDEVVVFGASPGSVEVIEHTADDPPAQAPRYTVRLDGVFEGTTLEVRSPLDEVVLSLPVEGDTVYVPATDATRGAYVQATSDATMSERVWLEDGEWARLTVVEAELVDFVVSPKGGATTHARAWTLTQNSRGRKIYDSAPIGAFGKVSLRVPPEEDSSYQRVVMAVGPDMPEVLQAYVNDKRPVKVTYRSSDGPRWGNHYVHVMDGDALVAAAGHGMLIPFPPLPDGRVHASSSLWTGRTVTRVDYGERSPTVEAGTTSMSFTPAVDERSEPLLEHVATRDRIRRSFPHLDRLDFPSGEWRMRVVLDGQVWSSDVFETTPGGHAEVALTADPGRRFEARVVDEGGAPVPYASVRTNLQEIGDDGRWAGLGRVTAVADAAGRVAFDGVSGDHVLVWAEHRGRDLSGSSWLPSDAPGLLAVRQEGPRPGMIGFRCERGTAQGVTGCRLQSVSEQWPGPVLQVGELLVAVEGVELGPWMVDPAHPQAFNELMFLADQVELEVIAKTGERRTVRTPSLADSLRALRGR